MLIRLLYISKPVTVMDQQGLEAFMRPIRDHALTHNALHYLTGALAYSENCFAQALEGEESDVEALMAKIAKDPRHKNLEIIDKREVSNRAFPDWAMAFCLAPDFSASGMTARDLVRYLIEAAQRCNKVRAIPGYVRAGDESDSRKAV